MKLKRHSTDSRSGSATKRGDESRMLADNFVRKYFEEADKKEEVKVDTELGTKSKLFNEEARHGMPPPWRSEDGS